MRFFSWNPGAWVFAGALVATQHFTVSGNQRVKNQYCKWFKKTLTQTKCPNLNPKPVCFSDIISPDYSYLSKTRIILSRLSENVTVTTAWTSDLNLRIIPRLMFRKYGVAKTKCVKVYSLYVRGSSWGSDKSGVWLKGYEFIKKQILIFL